MAKITSYSYVPDNGWTGKGFSVPHAPVQSLRLVLGEKEIGIRSVNHAEGILKIETEDFFYRGPWTLTLDGDSYTRKDMEEEVCEGLDRFAACEKNGVLYRLYSPKATTPRPLLLFLHGGGNGGRDNITHICADYGCTQFAQKYPDIFVMAPQAPERERGAVPGNFLRQDFAHSDMSGNFGWYREYLGAVCDIIREMIAQGLVDEKRIYVTGMSMGGAGTLRAMHVGAGLFTAAVPVCPTMTPETFAILKGLTHSRLWIATAYVDHTIYRHKYIVDGVLALKDAGNREVHLTLYSPEELAAYGIATDPELSYKDRFGQNHMSWVPTYHDEHGIMSWLLAQVKD